LCSIGLFLHFVVVVESEWDRASIKYISAIFERIGNVTWLTSCDDSRHNDIICVSVLMGVTGQTRCCALYVLIDPFSSIFHSYLSNVVCWIFKLVSRLHNSIHELGCTRSKGDCSCIYCGVHHISQHVTLSISFCSHLYQGLNVGEQWVIPHSFYCLLITI
jgi:hypothetical protein